MRQQTLAMQRGFEKFGRKSKRELFLEEMDKLVPWAALVALIAPHYPKGDRGRPPVGLERMLRLYFLQQWFNLSDTGREDALCKSPELLHGAELKVWGDAAYRGQGRKMRAKAPRAQDMTSRRARYKQIVDQLQRRKNRAEAQVRSKVEHVFRVMERQFGFDRARYKGLAKNANRMFACFALVNLYITRKRLVPLGA